MEIENQSEKRILAHWTYTSGEWEKFSRWKALKLSIFHYFFYRVFSPGKLIPDIRITPDKIFIGNKSRFFGGEGRELRRVNITDSGGINLLEITFTSYQNGNNFPEEIRIPVPKGKLREAIELQEKLLKHSGNVLF